MHSIFFSKKTLMTAESKRDDDENKFEEEEEEEEETIKFVAGKSETCRLCCQLQNTKMNRRSKG